MPDDLPAAVPDLAAFAQRSTPHSMDRLEIAVAAPFEDFRARFERAVPPIDPDAMTELVERGAAWSEMEAAVAARAPHGFLLYATIEGSLLALAGHRAPAVEYLMGNHVIAERMFRHQPDTLLYAPLRILLRGTDEGRTLFVLDRPGTVFAGLGDEAVTKVGHELDGKVAALLAALGVGPR